MDDRPNFQPGQIVSLEHGNKKLYAEVIQVVTSRQLCWVRPLLLVTFTQEDSPAIADLRDASDLLWSVGLFQPALDVEVIGLLSQVLAKEPKPGHETVAKHQLNQFLHQIWRSQRNYEL
ncbi:MULTISPECIES: hypothetical protein [Nostocales]|uniref:Uncharacterized protein n=3 Tax=Nostocales TaxID=1161 RepID=A0A0C1QUR5_9CYAN|nr:hypothetical protein [Tolypothrix bouteillei]KAF3889000.1 hypothetical protein DA73_0400028620 [Tolypothrix bouteillei VB521301]